MKRVCCTAQAQQVLLLQWTGSAPNSKLKYASQNDKWLIDDKFKQNSNVIIIDGNLNEQEMIQ